MNELLGEYEITAQRNFPNKSLLNGTIIGTNMHIKMIKRKFDVNCPVSVQRLKQLQQSLQDSIVLADNIFHSVEQNELNSTFSYYYVVEPMPSDKYTTLALFLQRNPSSHCKNVIFKQLYCLVENLHQKGVAHMQLQLKNIWIQHQHNNLQVYLKPYRIDINGWISEMQNCAKHKFKSQWLYVSPQFYVASTQKNQITNKMLLESDLFALGCIYSQLFFTLTPLLQISTLDQLKEKYVEILGYPQDSHYTGYGQNTNVFQNVQIEDEPLIDQLEYKSDVQQQIISCLLSWTPEHRYSISEIMSRLVIQRSNVGYYDYQNQSVEGNLSRMLNEHWWKEKTEQKLVVTPKNNFKQINQDENQTQAKVSSFHEKSCYNLSQCSKGQKENLLNKSNSRSIQRLSTNDLKPKPTNKFNSASNQNKKQSRSFYDQTVQKEQENPCKLKFKIEQVVSQQCKHFIIKLCMPNHEFCKEILMENSSIKKLIMEESLSVQLSDLRKKISLKVETIKDQTETLIDLSILTIKDDQNINLYDNSVSQVYTIKTRLGDIYVKITFSLIQKQDLVNKNHTLNDINTSLNNLNQKLLRQFQLQNDLTHQVKSMIHI